MKGERKMIIKQVKGRDFTLELKLSMNNPEEDVLYENGMEMIVQMVAGAICSGDLFPYFLKELKGVVENLMSAIQVEKALEGDK